MKLFIIGNGFDLGHNMKTKYWNFREYLSNMYPDFLEEFEKHYRIFPSDSQKDKEEILWNSFETNLANIDDDIIIENALQMDLGLESGDIGVYETLYEYFSDEYKYIEKLSKYLKQWVRTINVRDVLPRTTLINNESDAYYITFNYTAVLENVYCINPAKILHIHGSLRDYTDAPIIGHGNNQRIEAVKDLREQSECDCDEKKSSIYDVVLDYYTKTYKDVSRYLYKLSRIAEKLIDEIIIIGHSIEGVDLPYFRTIERLTNSKAIWTIYCFNENEKFDKKQALLRQGIDKKRIFVKSTDEFYNLSNIH